MDPQLYILGLIVLGLPAVSGSIYLLTKPLVKLAMHKRELKAAGAGDAARLEAQDHRFGQLEGELAALREEMSRLQAVEGFYKELRAPDPLGTGALPPTT